MLRPGGIDRRSFVRYKSGESALITTAPTQVVRIVDVSLGGMLVEVTGALVEIGEEITLKFQLKEGEPSVDARAKVLRHDGKQMGLEFAFLMPLTKRAIEAYVATKAPSESEDADASSSSDDD